VRIQQLIFGRRPSTRDANADAEHKRHSNGVPGIESRQGHYSPPPVRIRSTHSAINHRAVANLRVADQSSYCSYPGFLCGVRLEKIGCRWPYRERSPDSAGMLARDAELCRAYGKASRQGSWFRKSGTIVSAAYQRCGFLGHPANVSPRRRLFAVSRVSLFCAVGALSSRRDTRRALGSVGSFLLSRSLCHCSFHACLAMRSIKGRNDMTSTQLALS